MTNKITILAISTIILSVTFIPLAEASVGWNGFLQEIGFGGPQIYEVSAVSVIPAGELFGNQVQIRCLDGDRFLTGFPTVTITIDPSTFELVEMADVGFEAVQTREISEGNPVIDHDNLILIGVDTETRNGGLAQPFEIPLTITGLCLNSSPFASAVGGDWQGTDTVALFIGYSVLNAYWLAPTLAGLAAGIYLTRTKWKR